MPAKRKSREEILMAIRTAWPSGAWPDRMEQLAAAAGTSVPTLYRLFQSRQSLLRELDIEAPPTPRDRVLRTALELVGRHGLAELSMDRLAVEAGVSRATLYRLFPGKPALFRELVRTFSPWESAARLIESAPDRSPPAIMPQVGRVLVAAMEGRTALLLRVLFEIIRGDPDTAEGATYAMAHGLPDILQYLGEQIAAGRLRRTHPIVAFQLLVAPLVAHLLTRPVAESFLGGELSQEEAVDQIVQAWLRALAPPETGS